MMVPLLARLRGVCFSLRMVDELMFTGGGDYYVIHYHHFEIYNTSYMHELVLLT